MPNPLRDLPSIDRLLGQANLQQVLRDFSREEVVDGLRNSLASLRQEILAGRQECLPDFDQQTFADTLRATLTQGRAPSLQPVINATGIIIHTNLGRARLAPSALQMMNRIGAEPSNLEFDLASGKRGTRHAHVEQLICDLTGAEAAVVVNNCAAAVLLALMATATGRNVVASRGELIEIGGSFRLPDVIAQSGARLREVGATNKTRLSDYENAIDPDTAVLLKSHTSNFRIVGFTAAPAREDLAQLAQAHDVILIEDLGSGVLVDLAPYGLPDEPVVADILTAGVDLVMFSGDKLLGGPQAGVLAGRADVIATLKAHPLMRAVRIDKLSLAALEATLRLYRAPHDPFQDVPVLRMLATPLVDVQAKAETLAQRLRENSAVQAQIESAAAFVGGGSLPQQDLASFVVRLRHPTLSADGLSQALRAAETPVIGRIDNGCVLLDLRTMETKDIPLVAQAVAQIAPK